MEKDKVINYDDSIVSEINDKNFKLSINASSFSSEYYTVDYINSIFAALNNCCNICDSAINNIKAYFTKQSEIENIREPDLINIDFMLDGNVNISINDEVNEFKKDLDIEVEREEKDSKDYEMLGNSGNKGSYNSTNKHFTQSEGLNINIDGSKMITAKIVLNTTIFTGATLSSSIASIIRNETDVKIIGEENGMYKIIYGENLENIGYVSKDNIKDINVETGMMSEIKNIQIITESNQSLRVYSSSNLNSSNGDILSSGANIKIIGEVNNTCKIIYGDTFDKIGYINKNYIN